MHRYPAVNSGCLLHMPHCVCALRVDRLFTFVTSKAVSKSGYQSFRTQLCDGGSWRFGGLVSAEPAHSHIERGEELI